MKTILLACLCMLISSLHAQTIVNKSYSISGTKELSFNFDFPKNIKFSTWDKNEVSLSASVNINGGDNNEAFLLEEKTENGVLIISSKIKDYDKLPRTYVLQEKGSKDKITFKTKEAMNDYMQKNGRANLNYWGGNVDIDITIEVKVPANLYTSVKATYGIVELNNFNGSISVNATYGGIDASIQEPQVGTVSATTKYGQIYTNMQLNLTEKTEKDFYTSITAATGKGPAYKLNSTYGNLYLRKQR
jgi:hypothetical protein